MRRKRKQNRLQSIGEVLSSVLKRKGMNSKIEENALFKLWIKAVGPQIGTKTCPDHFRGGTLFVRTVSSVWVQELHFIKEEIRGKLNKLAGKEIIREIHFLVGQMPAQVKTEEKISKARKLVLKERDKKMIADCTEALSDPELASIFERIMHLEISRRRQLENEKVR